MKVISIGEVLWDDIGGREFLGGAPLNVCANLQRLGDEAVLVSAVGNDPRGLMIVERLRQLALDPSFLQVSNERPTAVATVGQDAAGEHTFGIQRPAAFDDLQLTTPILKSLSALAPDWLYMGTLLQSTPALETGIQSLLSRMARVRCFYDMNLRQGHWSLALVRRLSQQADVLKLNYGEAVTLAERTGMVARPFSLARFCRLWADQFQIETICVTLGSEGCFIYTESSGEQFPGYPVQVKDTVGAGDAFSAAFLHAYHRRWPVVRCAAFANALGALVASRAGATPAWSRHECERIAASL